MEMINLQTSFPGLKKCGKWRLSLEKMERSLEFFHSIKKRLVTGCNIMGDKLLLNFGAKFQR